MEVPEKDPPRTTTICRFEGAIGDVDVRWVKLSVDGGSEEWRSIGEGRMRSIAGSTLIDMLS
jgi:hypothetical protein